MITSIGGGGSGGGTPGEDGAPLVAKGAFNNLTAYVPLDVVTLSGTSYICILANTGHSPPDETYWMVNASKGDTGAAGGTGATGETFNPTGEWSNVTTYEVFDLVSHNGSSYICLQEHLNQEPPGSNWQLSANVGATGATGASSIAGTFAFGATTAGALNIAVAPNIINFNHLDANGLEQEGLFSNLVLGSIIRLICPQDISKFLYSTIDSYAINTGVISLNHTSLQSGGGFSNGDNVEVTVFPKGNTGSTGLTGMAGADGEDGEDGVIALALLTADTNISGPADKDLLQFDNGSGKWVNIRDGITDTLLFDSVTPGTVQQLTIVNGRITAVTLNP